MKRRIGLALLMALILLGLLMSSLFCLPGAAAIGRSKTLLWDRLAQAAPAGIPLQGCGLFGDVNDDGVVDTADLQVVAGHWRAQQGDPSYVADYDLNGDGIIDVIDVMLVARHVGDTCSTPTYTPTATSTSTETPTATPSPTETPTATPAPSGPTNVCGTISANTTWGPWGNPYILTCDVTVSSEVTLAVQPGVEVRANQGYGLTVNGTLLAVGTASQPITFTANATSPAPGYWKGISLGTGSGNSRLEYINIAYGGYGISANIRTSAPSLWVANSIIGYSSGYGLYAAGASSMTISNTIFISNLTYAAYIWLNNGTIGGGDNTGFGNGRNGIALTGSLGQDTTLPLNQELPYIIPAGGLTVNSGVTLTLPAGTVVKMEDARSNLVVVEGTLLAQGTEVSPVYITSVKDDSVGGDTNNDGASSSPVVGDWGGLTLSNTASASRFHHAVVRYGGDPTIKVASSALTVTGSTLEYNKRALWYENSTGVITSTKFLSNTEYALYETSSGLTVQGNEFRWNQGGIYLRQAREEHELISQNIFQNNTKYSIWVDVQGILLIKDDNIFMQTAGNAVKAESGILNRSLTMHSGPTYVLDSLDVETGVTLTLEAGVVVKFESTYGDNYNGFRIRGTLLAQGSNDKPVVLTSIRDDSFGGDTNYDGSATKPAPRDWYRLSVYGTGIVSLDHVIMQYAGYPYNSWSFGIAVSTGGTLFIRDSVLSSNGSYGIHSESGSLTIINTNVANHDKFGIYLFAPGTISPVLRDNTFSNNGVAVLIHGDQLAGNATLTGNSGFGNSLNGIDLDYTNIGGETVLANNINFPYVLRKMVIPEGQHLILQAGTVLKFKQTCSECYYGIEVKGKLQTNGTSEEPVVFTSLRDDNFGGDTNGDSFATKPVPGDWDCLYIGDTGSVTLTHTIVQYAGYPYNWANDLSYVGISNSGSLSVSNSILAYNGKVGIRHDSGNLIVKNSQIYGHEKYGIYNRTADIVDAENNWWGSDSGPAPYGSGNGINYKTCYDSVNKVNYICQFYVDADPWLGKADFVGSQMGQSGPGSRNQAFEAEPVNTANGNYLYQHTDLSILTRGLPLDFTRAYNSLDPQPGPLGWGWTHNWNLRLTEPTTDTAVITFGDGHMEKWTWTGSTYEGAPGVFGILVKNGDGSWGLTQKDQTRYHFAADGKLAWAEDKNGNRTTLAYDAQGRLTAVTEPAGRPLIFEYASPVSTTLISRITDPASRTIQFTYNITGELTTVTDVTGQATMMTYDANHRLLTITDANGHTFVRNVYDANGRVKEQYDALNNKTTFAYDEPAHKTLVTDPRGYVTTYQYDSEWRLVSEKDALNYTVTYAYDADNNRIRIVDKRGYTTTIAYDDRGNILVITDTLGYTRTFTYDSRNNLLSETDSLGHTTAYEYDARGNLIRRTDALGNVTTWAYNAYGQMRSTTDARGSTTQYAYDVWGNQTVITDALGHAMTFTYDNLSRKLSETDPLGRTTHYAYDAANRLTVITNTLGYTTIYTYDVVGNRIAMQDALGRLTQYGYDAKDRLTIITDTLGNVTRYAYDANDNRTSVTDARGSTFTFTYDALNRLISLCDPLGKTTSYQYDANGNRTRVTDAKGQVTNYTYDALNRLTGIAYADGSTVTYTYDAAGNRLTMTDPTGTTQYAYDALNRLTVITETTGLTLRYTYDAAGNRATLTYPDGKVVTYAYDADNRIASVTDHASRTARYVYDAAGQLTQVIYPNDIVGTHTYDDLGRLIAITYTYPVSGTLAFFHYTLDAVGNRISSQESGGNLTYVYDSLDRLTSVAYPDGEQVTYTYDAAGNRTALTSTVSGTTVYTYDVANRLLTAGGATATWDANGNMLTKGGTAYTYDAANRLTQAVSGTTTVQYTYNGDGKRVGRIQNNSTTHYLWDTNSPLALVVLEVTDGVTTTYLYGADLLAQYDAAGNPIYFLTDGQGNVRLLVDGNGNVVGRYNYDVFGSVRSFAGTASTAYRNAGHADDDVGLIYMRARWYDPALGRFLMLDPRLPGSWNPQDWNLYIYGRNNPMVYIDAEGEIPLLLVAGAAIVGYYGFYKPLANIAQRQRAQEFGNAYANTHWRLPESEEQMLQADQELIRAVSELQTATLKVAVSVPGTSLNPVIPSIPSTLGEIAMSIAQSKIKSRLYDWAFFNPMRRSTEESLQRVYGVAPLESGNPTTGIPYYYIPSSVPNMYFRGGAVGRPGEGK